MKWEGIIEHYREYLPVSEKTPAVTLYEGNTPLVHAKNLSQELGINLYFKYEGLNPTGSFKDRGMVMAVAKAAEEGSEVIMCASTGNTSAAAAAYAARMGMRCVVLVPAGNIALGKLAQAIMYGAQVVAIEGNFDQALTIVRDITEREPITLVNSVNPYRIEGQKTAAFEICDQLGAAPDYLVIPVGNAGNITAYWKGFKEYFTLKKVNKTPIMFGFEAEGAAAIVKNQVIEQPETIATAIRIGNPASWQGAVNAAQESNGKIDMVTDAQIIEAYKLMARREGIFAEPGSAASLAGVLQSVKDGKIPKGATVVSVLTGNGLKDPDTALKVTNYQPEVVSADRQAVMKKIIG